MIPNLKRPMTVFDIEGTGLDTGEDRIVSIALCKVSPGNPMPEWYCQVFKPGKSIPKEVSDIIRLTDADVAEKPAFALHALAIYDFLEGSDLAGFNLLNYDIPILVEEFFRCGLEFSLRGRAVVDAGNIFKKKEPRTLSAAYQFYCGKSLGESAHDSEFDTEATLQVLMSQLLRYPDLANMDIEALAEFSRFEPRLDLAGKIGIDEDGDPVYNLGKNKGKKVKSDTSFAYWMLGKDFPRQTKEVLKAYLDELQESQIDAFSGPY